jgi:hypothetical protein
MKNRNKDGTFLVPAGDKQLTVQDRSHTYVLRTNTRVLTSIVKQVNALVKEQIDPASTAQ